MMHAHHCQSSHASSCTDPLPCAVTQIIPFQSIPTKLGNVSVSSSSRFLKHPITAPGARHMRPLGATQGMTSHCSKTLHLPCISLLQAQAQALSSRPRSMACGQLTTHQILHLYLSLLGLSAQQAWATTMPERQLMES